MNHINKQHIIFSEEYDDSTNRLIDWLIFYKQPYHRYNGNHKKNSLYNPSSKDTIYISNETIFVEGEKIISVPENLQIASIFYRRPVKHSNDFCKKYKKKSLIHR